MIGKVQHTSPERTGRSLKDQVKKKKKGGTRESTVF